MSRPLAVLLTLSGLVVTIGLCYLILVFAGAAAGNSGSSTQFTTIVFPIAVILLAVQAISAVALLLSRRHVASVVVAVGPLALGLVAIELVFKVLPPLLKLFQ